MFRCDGGHLAQKSDPEIDLVMRMTRITVAVREVENRHYVPDPKHPDRFILVKVASGTEIVKEGQFCHGCVERIHPTPVVVNRGNPEVRTHIITPTRHFARQSRASD